MKTTMIKGAAVLATLTLTMLSFTGVASAAAPGGYKDVGPAEGCETTVVGDRCYAPDGTQSTGDPDNNNKEDDTVPANFQIKLVPCVIDDSGNVVESSAGEMARKQDSGINTWNVIRHAAPGEC